MIVEIESEKAIFSSLSIFLLFHSNPYIELKVTIKYN